LHFVSPRVSELHGQAEKQTMAGERLGWVTGYSSLPPFVSRVYLAG
jgi:hypothetical protein